MIAFAAAGLFWTAGGSCRGHGKLFDTLLGSVSTACVRHAVCPVVVVPPDRELPRHAAPRSETAAALY